MSFPNRGKWGKSNWRGNASGHVYKELFEQLCTKPDSASTPMWAGQSHLNTASLEHSLHINGIPSGASALALDAQLLAGFLFELGQRNAPEASEIRRRMVLAHLAGVLPEAHVQRPVQCVLH